MNVEEFIKKHHPITGTDKPWISYCEIIITKDGEIHEAIPSHERKLIELCCKELNISESELRNSIKYDMAPGEWMIDRIECVSVWYDSGIAAGNYLYNDKIVHILERLEDEQMICPMSYMNYKISKEYHLQLYREKHGWYK